MHRFPRLLTLAAVMSLSIGAAPTPLDASRSEGAQADAQLSAQFGGAYTARPADYVRTVGQRIAAQSGMAARPGDYKVTLLNASIGNAFAMPGGYVYVTRNLVALMNNEAELAFVMGHEVGHVAANHAQKRQTRSVITSVGAALLGAITGSNTLGSLAGQGAQLYTLGYSRDQEREADSLGVRYLARAGYDPSAGASILAALEAQTTLDARLAGRDNRAPSTWLSSHPATAERVARVRREAETLRNRARTLNRDAFLNAIDGMPYGDDPAQGVIEGQRFLHPGLRVAFDAPPGFAMQNNPDAVIGAAEGRGQFKFGGGTLRPGDTLEGYSGKVWRAVAGDQANDASPPRRIGVNGVETVVSTLRAQSDAGPVDVTLAVYRWDATQVFSILTTAPAGRDPGFDTLINSVRRLTPAEAARIRGRKISVVSVGPRDTVASLAGRMAYADDRVARFTVLNGLDGKRLAPGDRVKLIVWK